MGGVQSIAQSLGEEEEEKNGADTHGTIQVDDFECNTPYHGVRQRGNVFEATGQLTFNKLAVIKRFDNDAVQAAACVDHFNRCIHNSTSPRNADRFTAVLNRLQALIAEQRLIELVPPVGSLAFQVLQAQLVPTDDAPSAAQSAASFVHAVEPAKWAGDALIEAEKRARLHGHPPVIRKRVLPKQHPQHFATDEQQYDQRNVKASKQSHQASPSQQQQQQSQQQSQQQQQQQQQASKGKSGNDKGSNKSHKTSKPMGGQSSPVITPSLADGLSDNDDSKMSTASLRHVYSVPANLSDGAVYYVCMYNLNFGYFCRIATAALAEDLACAQLGFRRYNAEHFGKQLQQHFRWLECTGKLESVLQIVVKRVEEFEVLL